MHFARLLVLGLSLLLGAFSLHAAPLEISIQPRFDGAALAFDRIVNRIESGQTISVSRLDMLISRIALRGAADGTWVESSNSFAFISGRGGRTSFKVAEVPAGGFDRIRFNIGLPEAVNHADPVQFGPEHPLNPRVNGLHWSWQGGYVFLAMEGGWKNAVTATATENSARNTGGYSWHLATERQLMTVEIPISLDLADGDCPLALAFHLDRVFSGLTLNEETQSTHSRAGDETAKELTRKVTQAFAQIEGAKVMAKNGVINSARLPTSAKPKFTGTPYRFSFPEYFPIPALPRDNPLTVEGVGLGDRLFHDPQLSRNGRQSCSSCHQAGAGFVDAGKALSLGTDGRSGKRNAMTLFNLAWKSSYFWDGRAATLRQQALMPIQDELEMHESLTNVVAKLANRGGTNDYPQLFARAFGTREITSERVGLALEQFLLTLTSYDSKFDRVMRRQEEFTADEARGSALFFTEFDPRLGLRGADCFHCHGGPLFQNIDFANNGLDSVFKDRGLYAVTQRYGDLGKFAVPSLRNVELTGPYMHDGRFATLEQVVEHYSTGIKDNPTLDPNIAKHPDGGVPLSADDKRALVAFLKTLTDDKYKGSGTEAGHAGGGSE